MFIKDTIKFVFGLERWREKWRGEKYGIKISTIVISMNRIFIKKHIVPLSVVCFLIIYGIMIIMKPSFLYNRDGSLREFGMGRTKNTIIPIWLMSIFIAVLSYIGLMYYIALPRILR